MFKYPNVHIVLVNWNGSADTLECLVSIENAKYPNYHVVIVDNGSSAESVDQLHSRNNKFTLIKLDDNYGYTGGNNVGIRFAVEHGADYVFLLNNDTNMANDALEKLVEVAESNPDAGIVTPKILCHPKRTVIWAGGTQFNKKYIVGRLRGYGAVDAGQYDNPDELQYAVGCAMLIRRAVFDDVGLLCDDYFAVAEDLDFGLRVRNAGYRIFYVPDSVIWHKESASTGGNDAPQYVYYQTRNWLLLHNKWANGWGQLMLSQCYVLLHFFKRGMRFALVGKWRNIAGLFYGIRDGFFGLKGRREYRILIKTKADAQG